MASATRVQLWIYAVLLLLVTVLATLLGTGVAEAASAAREDNNGSSSLSLLVVSFVFSLAAFAYLLMFLIVRQQHPNSRLVWLASDCAALTLLSTFGLGLEVGATAMLWICSVLLIIMLAYLLIIKAVNHPGREAWTRSVRSLAEDTKPRARRVEPTSNRVSAMFAQDPYAEPEAVRPILNVDLAADNQSLRSSSPPRSHYAPSLPYSHTKSSTPYSSSAGSHSNSQSQASRTPATSNARSQISQAHSNSHSRPSYSRDRSATTSSHRTAQTGLAVSATHSRSHSQNALPTAGYDQRAPPLPPLPQVVIDEKRRERQPDAYLPSTGARGNLKLYIPARRDADEGTILSATSDVFSVMADFAGSPRSPRTDFHEYPPVQPMAMSPDLVARGTTPRPLGIEMWILNTPVDTPPMTCGSQWSTNGSHRPLPSVSSSATYERSGHARMASSSTAAAASGLPLPAQREPPTPRPALPVTPDSYTPYAAPYLPASSSMPGHQSQEDEATLFFNSKPNPSAEEATLFFSGKPPQPSTEAIHFFNGPRGPAPGGDEATLFFHEPWASARAPTPPGPAGDEATLFFNGRTPAPPSGGDEATLFFNAPAPQQDEATLFFNAPAPQQDKATLFFNAKPPSPPQDEATLFFNVPAMPRPPSAAVSPDQKRSRSVSPPKAVADEEEATLFFPSRP